MHLLGGLSRALEACCMTLPEVATAMRDMLTENGFALDRIYIPEIRTHAVAVIDSATGSAATLDESVTMWDLT